MTPIVTEARAKLNLTLDVLGRREDGYHDLCMVMQSVALCDTVTIEREEGGKGIKVRSDLDFLPSGRNKREARAGQGCATDGAGP